MEGAASVGFCGVHNYNENLNEWLEQLRWERYSDNILSALYGLEKNKEGDYSKAYNGLKRLDSVLEDIGMHIPTGMDYRESTEWTIKNMFDKNFPPHGGIYSRVLNLMIAECREKDIDRHDIEGQYKSAANFVKNCQRTIKRILNSEPTKYCIPEERSAFISLMDALSYPPKKGYDY